MSRNNVGVKIFVIVCLALLLWVGCASAATLIVNQTPAVSTSGDIYCDTIQEAVDMAEDGDSIIVCPGTYREDIVVSKSVDIRSYAGSAKTTIEAKSIPENIFDAISAEGNYSAFNISANNVKIAGFTIKGGCPGLFLNEVSYCKIINNTLIGCLAYGSEIMILNACNNYILNNVIRSGGNGISLSLSNNNTLVGNNITDNSADGIWMNSSSNNVIRNNLIELNDNHGICLLTCYNNSIEANIISDNGGIGVDLNNGSSYNNIENNTIKSNYMGISLSSSNKNTIKENTVSENTELGIDLGESHYNVIESNDVTVNDGNGIELSHSSNNNKIENNTALGNLYGVELNWHSSNNIIKNNVLKANHIIGISLDVSSNNNIIEKNIVLDNHYGIYIYSRSSTNIVKNNIVNSNSEYGIFLTRNSNDNIIVGNIAFENDNGITLSYSDANIIINNIIKSNYESGIGLHSSNYTVIKNNNISLNRNIGISIVENPNIFFKENGNLIYHNNIIDNYMTGPFKGYNPQVSDTHSAFRGNNWYHPTLLEGNYWSDYEGVDDGSGSDKHAIRGDGIGDMKTPHPEFGYDKYPYMNKTGWLTFLASPEYWDFGTVYQGDFKPQKKIEIQNRGKNNLTIYNVTADKDVEITGIEIPATISAGTSKSFNVTIETKNLEDDILKTLKIVSNDKITPNKTILMYGFVKVYTPNVRIGKTEFESRVIQGQINLFQISVNNSGVANEINISVNLMEGDTVVSEEIQELGKNKTKTVTFKWDTNNVSLGIHEIKIDVISNKGELLDRLEVRVYVLPTTKASTLIVTNLKRMAEKWKNDNISELEEKLIELSFHPNVNGIIVYVEDETNCSKLYDEWDNDKGSVKANEIAKAIKSLIDSKFKEEYPNIEYMVIVGDDRIIPYYRITDNTDKPFGPESWRTEDEYRKLNRNSTVGSAIHNKMFLTDNIYATDRAMEMKTADVTIPELFVPGMPIGRLVESPGEISATIDAFYQKDYISPDKIFVTGGHFMKDSALYCSSLLKEEMGIEPEIIVNVTPDYTRNIVAELLNTSNNIVLVFQHADHNQFYIYGDREINITSQNIAQSVADLNSSIVYSLGCHSGLNVPINASDNDFDLVQAYVQKGVLAYIAPTGYSIGSHWTRAAHELLISYFTRYLCEDMDAGTALTLAKQEYWATNYDFNYFDEQVLETTTLYGLPMARINMPRPTTSGNESEMRIMSLERKTTENPDTIVIRPTHTLKSAHAGQYYITTSEEHLSDPRKPVQPKEIRIFHPTSTKMLHGAVMTSGKYKIIKSFVPLIEWYERSPEQKPEPVPTELENWYPAPVFKINTINYPNAPMRTLQYMIIVTGQYKGGMMGTERLYDELSFDLYYASPEEETIPPIIEPIKDPIKINDTINISVNASDKSGIQRVLVTYTDGRGEWKSKDLNKTGELWTCEIPVNEISEFFVQAVDNNGNVAVGKVWNRKETFMTHGDTHEHENLFS